jgi:hypothetical protein
MRWHGLFDDLSAQWDAEVRRELDVEVADRTRRERASLGLRERLAAARLATVRVTLTTGDVVEGRVADVGQDWVLLDGVRGVVLVPLAGAAGVVGAGSGAETAAPGRRFALGYALRGLSRDRAVVAVHDTAGAVHTGTIDAVGRDVLELSEHAADVPRRPANVTGRRLVPFAALVLVRPAS